VTEPTNNSSAVAEISEPFGHNRHEPKSGGYCDSYRGRSWVPSNTMLPGLRPTSLPSAILIHPATTDMVQNWGFVPLLSVGELGPPSNTTWPGPRPTTTSSGILNPSNIWPQYNNVTDQTDRTDNGLIEQAEPFYKQSPKYWREHNDGVMCWTNLAHDDETLLMTFKLWRSQQHICIAVESNTLLTGTCIHSPHTNSLIKQFTVTLFRQLNYRQHLCAEQAAGI